MTMGAEYTINLAVRVRMDGEVRKDAMPLESWAKEGATLLSEFVDENVGLIYRGIGAEFDVLSAKVHEAKDND